MQTFKVGQAPWETQQQSFPVGSAPWEQEQPKPESDMGYIKRVASQYMQGAKDVMGAVQTGADAIQQNDGSFFGNLKTGAQLARTGLRTAGAVAHTAFSPILEAPGIKQLTEAVAGRVAETPIVSDVIKSGMELAQKYPNAARDVRDIFDIVTLSAGKAAEAPVKNELTAIGQDVRGTLQDVLTPSEQSIQNKVIDLFQKSIKPTAKKTMGQAEKYNNDVLNALRTIKANVNDLNIIDETGEIAAGRLPQSINELAQGLEQTKSLVFKQYDDLAKQAGTQGVTIDARPIADEVAKVVDNKALQLTNPGVIKYAEEWATRLRSMSVLDTETTQEVIKLMNTNLDAFYRNPTYDTASRVAVDAGIANNFRKALDNAIEGATGESYQLLKNQYSALKSIENDVVRASMREARKNAKGLIDYTDMFTGGQIVGGILSLNPAMFTKGAIERGFKEYIKYLNDPNRAVKNIFEKIRLTEPEKYVPKSSTFKSATNPSVGMSISNSVRPDLVAKKMTPDKIKTIEQYLAKPQDAQNGMNAMGLMDEIGIGKADRATQNRFLQDVVTEYKAGASKWTGTTSSKPSTGTSIPTVKKPTGKEGAYGRSVNTSAGFDSGTQPIYHYSPSKFDKFDLNKTEAGSVWFTTDGEALAKGKDIGSSQGGLKHKMERYIDPKAKIGDVETDDFVNANSDSPTTLQNAGYDGIKVKQPDGSYWYQIFDPEKTLKTASQGTKKANKK